MNPMSAPSQPTVPHGEPGDADAALDAALLPHASTEELESWPPSNRTRRVLFDVLLALARLP